MPKKKNDATPIKQTLHSRNRHQGRYDLELLSKSYPELAPFVHDNVYGHRSVDFFNPQAVLALNKALLLHYYGIEQWDVPTGYLCPPIPGRADYVHHMADVLAEGNHGAVPKGRGIRCLDIGVGASCVYPIIGRREYGWSFVGSDIDEVALNSANTIVESNLMLTDKVICRLQSRTADILHGVLHKGEHMDLVICNPPFHASAEEAKKGSIRKQSNLKGKKISNPVLNFGGNTNELWTEGGERGFILNLIKESKAFAKSCYCFSSLISKESNLKPLRGALKKAKVKSLRPSYGTRQQGEPHLTWSFLTAEERSEWREKRWE